MSSFLDVHSPEIYQKEPGVVDNIKETFLDTMGWCAYKFRDCNNTPETGASADQTEYQHEGGKEGGHQIPLAEGLLYLMASERGRVSVL